MKVGDLVRYKGIVKGLEGQIGIIVDWNGAFPVVFWNGAKPEARTTVIDMIEVINEGG